MLKYLSNGIKVEVIKVMDGKFLVSEMCETDGHES